MELCKKKNLHHFFFVWPFLIVFKHVKKENSLAIFRSEEANVIIKIMIIVAELTRLTTKVVYKSFMCYLHWSKLTYVIFIHKNLSPSLYNFELLIQGHCLVKSRNYFDDRSQFAKQYFTREHN